MKTLKVSFDFDDTLELSIVQQYATELVELGIEVWIVTSRMDDGTARDYRWNRNVFLTADQIGIKLYNINFCNIEQKYKFFKKNNDFLWHLDDDIEEIYDINNETDVVGVYLFEKDWKEKCNDIIKKELSI
jgi:hypothetical protein